MWILGPDGARNVVPADAASGTGRRHGREGLRYVVSPGVAHEATGSRRTRHAEVPGGPQPPVRRGLEQRRRPAGVVAATMARRLLRQREQLAACRGRTRAEMSPADELSVRTAGGGGGPAGRPPARARSCRQPGPARTQVYGRAMMADAAVYRARECGVAVSSLPVVVVPTDLCGGPAHRGGDPNRDAWQDARRCSSIDCTGGSPSHRARASGPRAVARVFRGGENAG